MKKGLVYFSFILFFGTQLYQTVSNQNQWPFCGYTMFNYTSPKVMKRWVVDVTGEANNLSEIHPGKLLPWEFFRAGSLISFIQTLPELDQSLFKKIIIKYFNNNKYLSFDEILPRANVSKVNELTFKIKTYDFSKED